MTLPTITAKQQAILKLLYRYRFVDRIQIQALMHHKDKRRIGAWLKDLKDKGYIGWIYDGGDFAQKTKPAVYYLSLNGIRYLRTVGEYPPEELRKRYTESARKPAFISKCLLLVDCCLNLEAQITDAVNYLSETEADYADPENEYHFLSELGPDLYFAKLVSTSDEVVTSNYLLEVFDPTMPRYMVKKRLKDYVTFLMEGDWELETGDDGPPIVLLASPTKAELIYAKRRTRKLLEDVGDDEAIHIRFATVEQIRLQTITGKIWEEA
jgi:hypothetical protein